MRAIFGRAVAPATATFQDLHDAANDAPIILPFDASHVGRQVRFDPFHCSSLSQKRLLRMIPILSKNESGSYCQPRKINEF